MARTLLRGHQLHPRHSIPGLQGRSRRRPVDLWRSSLRARLACGRRSVPGRSFPRLASVEGFEEKGIAANQLTHRNWFDDPAGLIPNPTPGASPAFLVVPSIRSNLATYGGLIDNTALQGTMFLPGGATAACNYGNDINAAKTSTFSSGGCGAIPTIAFAPDQKRAVLFTHGEFDLAPGLTLYGEAHLAYLNVVAHDFIDPQQGAANQFTIFSETPSCRPRCRTP